MAFWSVRGHRRYCSHFWPELHGGWSDLVELEVVRSTSVWQLVGHDDHVVVCDVAVLWGRRVQYDHKLCVPHHAVERRSVKLRRSCKPASASNGVLRNLKGGYISGVHSLECSNIGLKYFTLNTTTKKFQLQREESPNGSIDTPNE